MQSRNCIDHLNVSKSSTKICMHNLYWSLGTSGITGQYIVKLQCYKPLCQIVSLYPLRGKNQHLCRKFHKSISTVANILKFRLILDVPIDQRHQYLVSEDFLSSVRCKILKHTLAFKVNQFRINKIKTCQVPCTLLCVQYRLIWFGINHNHRSLQFLYHKVQKSK